MRGKRGEMGEGRGERGGSNVLASAGERSFFFFLSSTLSAPKRSFHAPMRRQAPSAPCPQAPMPTMPTKSVVRGGQGGNARSKPGAR